MDGPHRPFLLDYYYDDALSSQPVVIFCHGFKGFKDWGHFELMAKWFAAAGFAFVKFNFSHNGIGIKGNTTEIKEIDVFGNNNFSIEMDDLGFVIDQIAAQKLFVDVEVNTQELYLMGHSRGGGVVLAKSAEDVRIKKVVTLASVSRFDYMITPEIHEKWKQEGVFYVINSRTGQQLPLYYQLVDDYFAHFSRLHIEAAVKKLQTPGLIIHGTADEGVSTDAAYELLKWNNKLQLILAEQQGHVFGAKHPWNKNELPEGIAELLPTIKAFLLFPNSD